MRGLMQPGFTASRTADITGHISSAVSSGVPLQQAQVAINGPYRSILNDVEAPLQKGMSDQRWCGSSEGGHARRGHRGQSASTMKRARAIILRAVTARCC